MTYQIIILNSSVEPDSSFYVNGVFWLTANSNNIIPLPNFVSAVPFVDIVELGLLQTGQIIEQGFNSGLFPAGTTLASVQSSLQAQYSAAQSLLGTLNPPLGNMVGTTFDGSAWTSTSPFMASFEDAVTGTLGALNATVQIAVSANSQSVGIQVNAGTFVGTIIAENSFDGGNSWNQTIFVYAGSTSLFSKSFSITYASSPNIAQAGSIVVNGGAGLVRVRVFAYTSGSCTLTLSSSAINDQTIDLFTAQAGFPLPPLLAVTAGEVTTSAPSYTTTTVNALSLNTSGGLRVDGSNVTQPVSGTVATTQSGGPWTDNVTQFGGTNVSTGTGAGGAGIPRVTVSNDSNVLTTQSGTWTVQPGNTPNTTPWLATVSQGGNSAAVVAKGTQGTNALAVQEMKDAGRVSFVAAALAATGVTTEALMTLTPVRTVTAGATGASLTVTAGKTLRIIAISVTVRNTSTTQCSVVCRVRMNSTTVTATSQLMFTCGTAALTAVSGSTNNETFVIPDGFEISGTTQFGITQLASATACTVDVTIIGFEY
jgi:hypothetical protein